MDHVAKGRTATEMFPVFRYRRNIELLGNWSEIFLGLLFWEINGPALFAVVSMVFLYYDTI